MLEANRQNMQHKKQRFSFVPNKIHLSSTIWRFACVICLVGMYLVCRKTDYFVAYIRGRLGMGSLQEELRIPFQSQMIRMSRYF